jgi:hypothetical protein
MTGAEERDLSPLFCRTHQLVKERSGDKSLFLTCYRAEIRHVRSPCVDGLWLTGVRAFAFPFSQICRAVSQAVRIRITCYNARWPGIDTDRCCLRTAPTDQIETHFCRGVSIEGACGRMR